MAATAATPDTSCASRLEEAKRITALAAEWVYGVKAVASELEVKLVGAPRDDSEIAHVLESNAQVPRQRTRPGIER
jgi:hypothetical protein